MKNNQLEMFSLGSNARVDEDADLVCWTRMEAESGEQIANIIRRKEAERRAGRGRFFWGVGNALSLRHVSPENSVRLVFSRMLSKPKREDASPQAIVLWTKYCIQEAVYDLPPYAFITSKAFTSLGPKQRHFALVCESPNELRIRARRSFDPSAYRNAFGRGRGIGASQVTAIIRQVKEESLESKYTIDMEAKLVWPFCIKLLDPIFIGKVEEEEIARAASDGRHWVRFLASLKAA